LLAGPSLAKTLQRSTGFFTGIESLDATPIDFAPTARKSAPAQEHKSYSDALWDDSGLSYMNWRENKAMKLIKIITNS
jgi:hypothetical protein